MMTLGARLGQLPGLMRMAFSGRVLARAQVFLQYLYYMGLEALSRDLSLERPRFKAEGDGRAPARLDRTSSIELHLESDTAAHREFDQLDAVRQALVTNVADKYRTSRCFVCDTPLRPVVQVINEDDADDLMEVAWCPSCDHRQFSTMPPKSWVTQWYASKWDTSGSLAQKLETRRNTSRYYHRLAPYLPNRKLKVLEIGGGYGEKTYVFAEHGHELHCTEAAAGRAEYLRQNVTKNVYFGTLDNPAIQQALQQNAPFDLIFTYHVVEHIYDPRMELQLLRDIASPDAVFYLALPELYKEGILNNIYALAHIATFSRRSAATLMTQIGFRPIVAKNDLFQHYSNCNQYLIGVRAPDTELPVPEANDDPQKFVNFLSDALQLRRVAGLSEATFSHSYFGHETLTYRVSEESKRKCLNPANELPLRIYHQGLPLFWMPS